MNTCSAHRPWRKCSGGDSLNISVQHYVRRASFCSGFHASWTLSNNIESFNHHAHKYGASSSRHSTLSPVTMFAHAGRTHMAARAICWCRNDHPWARCAGDQAHIRNAACIAPNRKHLCIPGPLTSSEQPLLLISCLPKACGTTPYTHKVSFRRFESSYTDLENLSNRARLSRNETNSLL